MIGNDRNPLAHLVFRLPGNRAAFVVFRDGATAGHRAAAARHHGGSPDTGAPARQHSTTAVTA